MNMIKNKKGFTLIELLIVIGIISILAGIVLVAVNPAQQFGKANDSERKSEIGTLLSAIYQY
ncbi:type II secretion system protein, partial [Candidatus Pacearchaeota archaeon]|nr:type II secretion system protein [Candidatus Pacearchaeota archaeon]